MLYLFDVPVYRLTLEEFEAERDVFIRKRVDEQRQSPSVAAMYSEDPRMLEQFRTHLRRIFGGSWRFNEIIGFIRLHFLGTQIRGEWWRVTAKRVARSRNKQIEFRDPKITYEEEIPRGSSNAEIYTLILKYLDRAQREKHIKRFHIDTSMLQIIGPHVDWNALLQKANKPVQGPSKGLSS